MTLMQCMQRTQFLLSISSDWLPSRATLEMCSPLVTSLVALICMARVGHMPTTSLITLLMPCLANQALASVSSVRMLSRQVPMVAKSERWIELVQSFGQPENLNLNL